MPDHRATLFYDGHCGLCHRGVRFVMARDREGKHFVFAPLQGTSLREMLEPSEIARLPDSIVLLEPGGAVLTRSDATLAILRRLGGGWAMLAWVGGRVPRAWRDVGYGRVAAIRHRVFAQPDGVCPMMPPELRGRFKP